MCEYICVPAQLPAVLRCLKVGIITLLIGEAFETFWLFLLARFDLAVYLRGRCCRCCRCCPCSLLLMLPSFLVLPSQVHCRKVRMHREGCEALEHIARSTSGFSGAELANVVNEAAILAARWVRREAKKRAPRPVYSVSTPTCGRRQAH